MKNILHVVNIYFVLPYFLGEQLSFMQEKGNKVHIICSPSNELEEFSKAYGIDYKEIEILRSFNILKDIQAIISIYRYIQSLKINVVVGHTPKGGLLSMVASFIAGVPKRVYFRHGLVYETSSGLKKKILMFIERLSSFFATQVVCVSPYLLERSVRDRLTKPTKMIVLGAGSCNGVDVYGKFNPAKINLEKKKALRDKLRIPKDAWIIGFVGRLTEDKGIKELLDAFRGFEKSNVYLLLVGPVDSRLPLPDQYLNQLKENERIIMTGMVNTDLEYYYSIMNTLVLPTHREGLGTCLLEASSMEIPIIASGFTGSKDAIVNEITGLYTSLEGQDLYNKIFKFYNSQDYAVKCGKNGRLHMIEKFDQNLIWQELLELYST